MPTVAVLGCGPAGLFAAQALALHGITPAIISRKRKSVIYGAQYLHRPIPGLSPSNPTGRITTARVGAREVYAERVYGLGTGLSSWDRALPVQDAWDLRSTYENAWSKFSDDIVDMEVGGDDVAEMSATFDLVISTVPAWSICQNPAAHNFDSVAFLFRKEFDPEEIPPNLPPNFVVYNGTHDYDWVRCSNIFGYPSAEAPMSNRLVEQGGWEAGFKVVGNNCDCHPAIVKAGRMGTWQKGVLTHNAWDRTIQAMSEQFGMMPQL
jgi:hypothetical protein